jgi:beta-galactosidase
VWSELAHARDAEVLARYDGGPLDGVPAITRRERAWYLGTRLTEPSLEAFVRRVCAESGLEPRDADGAEIVRRAQPDGLTYLFILNHGAGDVTVAAHGVDLLTGDRHTGKATVPAGGVAVIRETPDPNDGRE